MSEIQDKIRDIREGSPTLAEALQEISRAKAQEVTKRWEGYPGKNMRGVASFKTRNGEATIGGVRFHSDPDRLDSVEVWVGPQQGPPTSRLINPPTLVPDPTGEVVLTEENKLRGKTTVRRYRVDPLQAIAEFIASHHGRSEQG